MEWHREVSEITDCILDLISGQTNTIMEMNLVFVKQSYLI